MDKSCEKPTRNVRLNRDTLIVSLVNCNYCDACKKGQDEIRIVDVVETDTQMKSAYRRWLASRERFVREVITLD